MTHRAASAWSRRQFANLPAFALSASFAVSVLLAGSACSRKSEPKPDGAGVASATALPQAARSDGGLMFPTHPRRWMRPTGPRFEILAGKGIGPIRIGATVPTIERHMQAKCEELTPERCRYISRAVDFELENGVTRAITISRVRRLAGGTDDAGEPRTYGLFNGILPPDLMLGMTPDAVRAGIGAPERTEKAPANSNGTEVIHYYPGMVLEYDRISTTGRLALGSVKIVKP